MATAPATPLGVEAIRVARLAADGTPDFNNPQGGFMLCGGISTFAFTVEMDTGADIYEKDATGAGCVIRKRQDQVKRVSFTLTMCKDDYRLSEILGATDAIIDGTDVVGRLLKTGAGCANPDVKHGVAIELWHRRWDCADSATPPFMRKVLPRAYVNQGGHDFKDGPSLPVYTGYSVPNSNFGDGPFGDLDLLAGKTGWAMCDINNDVVPTCVSPVGYINVPGSAS